jgi:hypothetical protein
MKNPEKLATGGTQGEDKQFRETGNMRYTRRRKTHKNTTQYVVDTTLQEEKHK